MVVRAFGKDHLLSINGKTTERIASEHAPGSESASAAHIAEPEEDLAIAGLDLGRKGSLLSKIMPPERPTPLDEQPANLPGAPRFGEALMKMAQGKQSQPPAPRATYNSDAVAGLLKLKERSVS